MKKTSHSVLWRALLIAALTMLLTGASAKTAQPIKSLEDLKGRDITIAVGMNNPVEVEARADFPQAKVVPYRDIFLAYTDVAMGRADICLNARREMQFALDHGLTGVRLLDDSYVEYKIAVGISPVSPIDGLKDRLNAFISELRADGTLDDMYDRWVVRDEETMPDIPRAENPAFTLRVGTTGSVMPYSYYVGTELAGYDIELAKRFARWLGADLEFKIYDFGGIIAAAESGSIDCIMSNLYYTPEGAETIPFSDVLFTVGFAGMVRDDGKAEGLPSASVTSIEQLKGGRIGVQTGTSFDQMVEENIPDATVEYYNTKADLVAALEGGKIDAFVVDEPVARLLAQENGGITWLQEYVDSYAFAPAFAMNAAGEALRDQFNAFLKQLPDGTLQRMEDKWFGEDEGAKTMPDIAALSAENGTLRVATEAGYAPFEYVRDGAVVGYDMELAAMFCEYGGYGLEIVDMSFDGILASVQSGKCDLALAGISITPERADSVLFSMPYFYGKTVVVVPAEDGAATRTVSWRDYNGKRIGVLVGPLMEDTARECFPDSEYLIMNSYSDCIAALTTGKIDAYLADEPEMKCVHAEQPEIDYIRDRITLNNYCFAFRKNDPESAALCEELNEFLAKSRADGTMKELDDIWFGVDEDKKVVDMSDLTGENGTIRVVTTSTDMPFSYIKDGKNVGYDIDLVVRFCRDRGYALELGDVDFSGRIPAIESGKYDFTTDMNATPERAEQVLFSDPTSYGGIVLAVRSADLEKANAELTAVEPASPSFIEGIASSFHKTFIRESRYKLFLSGIGTTLLITLLSILCGTALGFLVFMLCRNGNPAANLITRFCLWLVQGMPMVVLLMMLYYVVFGAIAISGIVVAVVGFTLTFGAAVFGLLKMGVGAVDRGQYEAAYALGYSGRRTFFKIILPQALPHVLPAYRGEIVGLIKATAVVGYIAVQDLTKMGDIVRSRTYEAFFPLIAVTVIYFALEGLIRFIVSCVSVNTNPKRRKRGDILRGIHTDEAN